MSEKTELEKHAVLEFCKAYKEQYGETVTYVGQCAPPLPDTRCNLNGKTIFIEVAHLYGKTSDAKKLLGRKGRASPRPDEEKQARFTPLHIRIGNELAGILQQKFKKTYADDSVWLVVRNANPLWDSTDFKSYLSGFKVPPDSPFKKIWLLCGPAAESGVLELPINGSHLTV